MLTYCWRWKQFHNCGYWRLSFWQNWIVSHFCYVCSRMGSDLQRQRSNLQLRIKIPGEVSGAFLSGTANFQHPIACNFTCHAFGNEICCFQGSMSPYPLRCVPGLVSLFPAGLGLWALKCSAFLLCLAVKWEPPSFWLLFPARSILSGSSFPFPCPLNWCALLAASPELTFLSSSCRKREEKLAASNCKQEFPTLSELRRKYFFMVPQ